MWLSEQGGDERSVARVSFLIYMDGDKHVSLSSLACHKFSFIRYPYKSHDRTMCS